MGKLFNEFMKYWNSTSKKQKKHDVVWMMWRILDKVCEHLEPGEKTYYSTFADVDQKVSDDMFIYDCGRETSIVYFVLGVLQGLDRTQIEVGRPVYGNRYGGGLIVTHEMHRKVQTMTYKQMNKMAEEAFA